MSHRIAGMSSWVPGCPDQSVETPLGKRRIIGEVNFIVSKVCVAIFPLNSEVGSL